MVKRDNSWYNDKEGLRNSPAHRLSSLLLGDSQNFFSGVSFSEAKMLTLFKYT